MAIETIEEAIAEMGHQLQGPRIGRLARQAIDKGATFEVVIIVKKAKRGSVVRMESRDLMPPRSHGSLIRLNGESES